jgi:phosphatidylglycerophosphatase A
MAMSPPGIRRTLMTHPLGWVATGFGSGLSPRAPGTVGSLVALLPWWLLLRHLPLPAYLAMLALTFALGCWAAHWVIRATKIEDPGLVVWDEFVGLWIALLLAPPGWIWMAVAFALFRLFDIWKPWPVSWADDKLHGGFGAMLDDALAGAYALLVLQLLHVLWEGLQAR